MIFKFYKYLILPLVNQLTGVQRSCRYFPSCSVYFEESVKTYGIKGVWMGVKRISRCQPWSQGGFDPIV